MMKETQYTVFDVRYELKGGKRIWTAYHGTDRTQYAEAIDKAYQRSDIARLYVSEKHTTMTEFD